MAAPSGTVWGSIVNGSSSGRKGRLGIYTKVTNTNTQTTVNVQVWFWTIYSCSDSSNTLYYDAGTSVTSATTSRGAKTIKHTVDSGSGWSTSNQTKVFDWTYNPYARGKSAVTYKVYAKLANIDILNSTVYANTSYTVPALASYTVKYNANGGTGAPGSQTKWYGINLTLSSTKPTRTGYSFQGWALSKENADNNTWYYQPGGTCGKNENLTLYAVWKANTYVIKYNANGGTGAPSSQTKTYGIALTLSSTKPTRTNYNFKGWATSSSSNTVSYTAGASYTANSNITLYAVWELAYVKPRITNLTADRYNDAATQAVVKFDWKTDKAVTAVTVNYISDVDSSDSGTASVTASGTSGSVSVIIGTDSPLKPERTYTVTAVVSDGQSSSSRTTLNGSVFTVDMKAGGNGIAFGKAAELDGVADFEFTIYSRAGYRYPILPAGTDLNTVLTPNIYSGENESTYDYGNCPITSGTFTLEVFPAGPSGQVVQRLHLCDKNRRQEYQRTYYGSAWGSWFGGWHDADLTALGNFTNYYSSGSEAPKYRRVGNTVEIRGTVKPLKEIAYSTDYTTIFTLPNGYRPNSSVFTLCQGSAHCAWLMRVDSNGDVGFTRYRNGDTSTTASTSVWLPFQCTFLVD